MMINAPQNNFQPPPLRTDIVSRADLHKRLEQGLQSKLILISAPAGYGKTTLISDWLQKSDRNTIWLSLNESDNDLNRFLSRLIDGLSCIEPETFKSLNSLLYAPQAPELEYLVDIFTTSLGTMHEETMLVLDDIHSIENPSIRNFLGSLVLSDQKKIQWVILTRRDPLLPLARMRARGELFEIRGSDLKFSDEEAEQFLTQSMNLTLAKTLVRMLNKRTEGWAAGLQLAALSMQNQDDLASYIQSFSGDDRHIMDFLLEEVLAHQDKPVYDFILKTSILSRFCAPLCDHLLSTNGQKFDNSENLIRQLDQNNLFLHPLDNNRNWYRYHHLFGGLLAQILKRTHPEIVSSLHIRSSRWYGKQHLLTEAMDHAYKAKDHDYMINLIIEHADEMWISGKASTLYQWISHLPEVILTEQPRLLVYRAWLNYYLYWQLDEAEDNLGNAELLLDLEQILSEGNLADLDNAQKLSIGLLAQARATITLNKENSSIDEAEKWSRLALEMLPRDNHIWRSMAFLTLGFAQDFCGQGQAALESLKESEKEARKTAYPQHLLTIRRNLATIEMLQGHLTQAQKTYTQLIELAEAQSLTYAPSVAETYLDLSMIHLSQNQLDEAEKQALLGIELGQIVRRQPTVVIGYIALAKIKQAQGHYEEAITCIEKAETLANTEQMSSILPAFEGEYARTAFFAGDQDKVVQWVNKYLPSSESINKTEWKLPNNWLEPEPLFFAYVLIHEQRYEDAKVIIDQIKDHANKMGRAAHVVESNILQSINFYQQGQHETAVNYLEEALSIAKSCGYVLLFVNKGQPMVDLLKLAIKEDIESAYASQLLTAITKQPEKVKHGKEYLESLIDTLSQREMEVLTLIAEGLSNDAIAEKLVLSLHTVKTHTRHIYNKLGVSKRTQAVAEARRLRLL